MHWTNLDNVPDLFTFQNSVSTTSSHLSDIQKLSAIDEVVV